MDPRIKSEDDVLSFKSEDDVLSFKSEDDVLSFKSEDDALDFRSEDDALGGQCRPVSVIARLAPTLSLPGLIRHCHCPA